MTLEKPVFLKSGFRGSPSARPSTGMTRVPSRKIMPAWGDGTKSIHSGCFNYRVRFSGADQVRSSSSEETIRNWALLPISNPWSDPPAIHWWVPSLPHIQTAVQNILPVLRSTAISGSPQPSRFYGSPPCSPMSIITRTGSQERPPSVLRINPTSTSSCRSRRFVLRMSKVHNNVP